MDLPDHGGGYGILSDECDHSAGGARRRGLADANSDANPDAEGHGYRHAGAYAYAHDYGANPRTGWGRPLVLPYADAYRRAYWERV